MKIGVLGAGTMGNGIAQVIAYAGLHVVLCDKQEEVLSKANQTIQHNLLRILKKQEKSLDEVNSIIAKITFTTDINVLNDRDIIIEAIVENLEAKKTVFTQLDKICNKNTIFASNTSGYSITELGTVTSRPDKVIGLHFFNPVPVLKLVEIIRGTDTSEETYQFASDFITSIGKESITILDAPLFVVNRILVPMINEAIFVLEEGIASVEDIDKGMQLGASHPIGPLALADLIGLETLLSVSENLFNETGDSKYRIPSLLRKKVSAGHLGRKTGKGFYEYE